MNITTRVFIFAFGVTTVTLAQQSAITSPGEGGLAALRTLASSMEKCQDAFVLERHWGKGRLEIERVYVGRPKNVVWRSTQAAGQLRPVGLIEFSSSLYVRVPKETAKKYTKKLVVEAADLPITSEGVAFVPTLEGFPVPDTQYRYEFDLRPEGMTLLKMSRTSLDGGWQAVDTGHPCAPKPK